MRYIFYQGDVTDTGVRNVQTLLAAALDDPGPEVTLCLASRGGDVSAGIGLYNFIGMLPFTINTHAAGICASIAATIFLAGARRTASPISRFSLHAAKFDEGPLKDQVSPNTELISEPFRTLLGWSDDVIAKRFDVADFRFGPDEAKEFGIIDDITDSKLAAADQMISVRI